MSQTTLSQDQLSTLFLISDLGIGGSERKIVRVANGLAARGHTIGIAYLNGPEDLREDISSTVRAFSLERRGKFSLPVVRHLRNLVERYSVKTLCTINLYPALYVAALKLANRNLRWIACINTTTFRSTKERMQMLLYVPLLWGANRYVFGSTYQEELWKQRYRLLETKVSCIHNGVDETFFHPDAAREDTEQLRRRLKIDKRSIVIGTVGQMRPEKRQDLILKAASVLRNSLPNLKVLLVGDGAKEHSLRDFALELGMERDVVFLGKQKDVRPALALMDIFILCSNAVETFSNAALEAMAMGKPVLLSDLSGAREMVQEGLNGCLLRINSSSDIIDRLRTLLGDSKRIRQMGVQARLSVEHKFTFEGMLNKYETLLSMERFL